MYAGGKCFDNIFNSRCEILPSRQPLSVAVSPLQSLSLTGVRFVTGIYGHFADASGFTFRFYPLHKAYCSRRFSYNVPETLLTRTPPRPNFRKSLFISRILRLPPLTSSPHAYRA